MKKHALCFSILLVSFLITPAFAIDVTFQWNANTESDLAGYRLYYGFSSKHYNYSVYVGNQTEYTLSGLDQGEIYYFALTAHDIFGNESDFSDEVIGDFRYANQPPIADAGPDQTVKEGDLVTLDGSKSFDPEDEIVSFKWSQVGGPLVNLSDPTVAGPVFIASESGELVFQLTVTDKDGKASQSTCCVLIQATNTTTIYEDGEDGTTGRWIVSGEDPGGAAVSNIYDSSRDSRVIALSGVGDNHGFHLTLPSGEEWHAHQYILRWSMNYGETFLVAVSVQTTAGPRLLAYTPVDYDDLGYGQNVHHGLGLDIVDGQWHTIIRDLQADLEDAQPGVGITEVNGLLLEGSGRIDDVQLLSVPIWEGDCEISTESDLKALSVCTAVTGNLSVKNSSLADLYGLTRLSSIGGYLEISNNPELKSLGGLENLASVGKGQLWINPGSSVDMSLFIANNPELIDLQGLDNLTTLEGAFSLITNASLTSLRGLGGLASIDGSMFIFGNSSLRSLDALEGLTSIGETETQSGVLGLVIANNAHLGRLGLRNLSAVSSTFWIYDNPALCTSLAADLKDQITIEQGMVPDINISGNNMYCATVYEDAEDGDTLGWSIFDNYAQGAMISNCYDSERKSRVIAVSGSADQNSYRLYSEQGEWWRNTTQFIIEWSMKYSESFTVYIYVQTSAGRRWLNYTPEDSDGLGSGQHVYHGLGSENMDGRWHTFIRDLQSDLQDAQPGVHITEVNGFLVRGSGLVDDIKLYHFPPIWQGDYTIDTVADLKALGGITHITGNLSIKNTSFKDLKGLESLTHIGGYLEITHNANMESLAGIYQLESIGKGQWNAEEGAADPVEAGLFITQNPALVSLSGLDRLRTIQGCLAIRENEALETLQGLDDLRSVGGALFIFGNGRLLNLEALQHLNSVGKTALFNDHISLVIAGNNSLKGLGLQDLGSIRYSFGIFDNPELCTFLAEQMRDQTINSKEFEGVINIQGNRTCSPDFDSPRRNMIHEDPA